MKYHSLIVLLICSFAYLQGQEQIDLVKTSGVTGGLCVYFDAKESRIAEMVRGGSFIVHALQSDAKQVPIIQAGLRQNGLAPFVCVEAWSDIASIPYKKNHITLAVAEQYPQLQAKGFKLKDLVNALSPLGKGCLGGISKAGRPKIEALLKEAGISQIDWKDDCLVFQKPWLDGMGTWTHRQRGSDGNAVGNDVYLGVPNQIQWITSGSSQQTIVGGGRAFYIHAKQIVARDAGSGVLLWKRKKSHGSATLVGDDVLVKIPNAKSTRPYQGDLVLLSGATGEVKTTFAGFSHPSLYENDVAITPAWASYNAVDLSTGKKLWELKYKRESPDAITTNKYLRGGRGNVPQFAMLMKDGKVCARRTNGEFMVLQAKTGEVLWKKNLKDELGADFAMHFMFDDKVLLRTEKILKHICDAGSNMMPVGPVNKTQFNFVAISLKDGSVVWDHEYVSLTKDAYRGQVYKASNRIWVGRHDVLIPDDLTDLGDHKKNDKKFYKWICEPDPMVFDGLNLETGKIEKTVTLPKQINFHCYQLTVTDRYHTGNRPYYFVSWETGEIEGRFGVVRSPCDGVGHFAAQGLFFARGMKGCGCIRTAMTAEGAFSSSDDGTWDGAVAQSAHPFEKGPAVAADNFNVAETDWPMLRSDSQRTGAGKAQIADGLKQLWHFQAKRSDEWQKSIIADDWTRSNFLGKKVISQAVIANNTAFISQLEDKSVCALDLASGKEKWRFDFPARVDAPPSIAHGLAFIGCADGWVYALRADNGERVYRLRIAPAERRIVAYGQLESSWPVVGGVLVVGEMAYAVAGRTTEVDGGLYVIGFNAKTGAIVWEGRRHLNNPGNIGKADHERMKNYGTGAADILSSDGKFVAIGTRVFGKSCFDVQTGKDGGKYSAIPYSTPLQSNRHRSVLSVVDRKSYTATSPTFKKKKVDKKDVMVFNKAGFIVSKNKWKLETEDSDAVAISAGTDRLAVALAKEGKNELWIVAILDGKKLASYPLPSKPTQDGIAIAEHYVLVTLEDGSVVAFGGK